MNTVYAADTKLQLLDELDRLVKSLLSSESCLKCVIDADDQNCAFFNCSAFLLDALDVKHGLYEVVNSVVQSHHLVHGCCASSAVIIIMTSLWLHAMQQLHDQGVSMQDVVMLFRDAFDFCLNILETSFSSSSSSTLNTPVVALPKLLLNWLSDARIDQASPKYGFDSDNITSYETTKYPQDKHDVSQFDICSSATLNTAETRNGIRAKVFTNCDETSCVVIRSESDNSEILSGDVCFDSAHDLLDRIYEVRLGYGETRFVDDDTTDARFLDNCDLSEKVCKYTDTQCFSDEFEQSMTKVSLSKVLRDQCTSCVHTSCRDVKSLPSCDCRSLQGCLMTQDNSSSFDNNLLPHSATVLCSNNCNCVMQAVDNFDDDDRGVQNNKLDNQYEIIASSNSVKHDDDDFADCFIGINVNSAACAVMSEGVSIQSSNLTEEQRKFDADLLSIVNSKSSLSLYRKNRYSRMLALPEHEYTLPVNDDFMSSSVALAADSASNSNPTNSISADTNLLMHPSDDDLKAHLTDVARRLCYYCKEGCSNEEVTRLAVEICWNQIRSGESVSAFDVGRIQTLCVGGLGSERSSVVNGLVVVLDSNQLPLLFSTQDNREGQRYTSIRNALLINGDVTESFRHAGYSRPVDRVMIHKFVTDLNPATTRSFDWLSNILEVIHDLKITALFVRGSVSNRLLEECNNRSIVVFGDVPYRALLALAECTGAAIVTYITDATEDCVAGDLCCELWSSDWLSISEDRHYIVIKTTAASHLIQTAVLCERVGGMLAVSEEKLLHRVHCLGASLRARRALLGGGATEDLLAQRLESQADVLECSLETTTPELQNSPSIQSLRPHAYRTMAATLRTFAGRFKPLLMKCETVIESDRIDASILSTELYKSATDLYTSSTGPVLNTSPSPSPITGISSERCKLASDASSDLCTVDQLPLSDNNMYGGSNSEHSMSVQTYAKSMNDYCPSQTNRHSSTQFSIPSLSASNKQIDTKLRNCSEKLCDQQAHMISGYDCFDAKVAAWQAAMCLAALLFHVDIEIVAIPITSNSSDESFKRKQFQSSVV